MFNGYLLMIMLLVIIVPFLKERDKSTKYVIFACIILILFIGIRDVTTIGVDSRVQYPKVYSEVLEMSFGELFSMEFRNMGLRILMKFAGSVLGLDYQWFIFLEMAIAYIIFGRMINKYSPSPMQSIVCHCGLLYFFLFMDALKQCMAMAFLCLAFDAIVERRPIKFVILTIVGAWFHLPAMIFLPAYWIANQKRIKYYLIELFTIFVLVFIFRNKILTMMTEAYGHTSEDVSSGFLMNKVLIMLFIIIVALIVRPPTVNDTVYIQLLQLMGVAAVLQTFAGFSNNYERLADYYYQFAVLFIPMVFEQKNTNSLINSPEVLYKIRFNIALISCIFFIYRFAVTAGDAYYYTPYKFFWT